MQVRHFFLFLLCSCFILLSSSAEAQEITTNELGEKIVVYPDGSWKYFDELGEEQKEQVKKEESEDKKSKKKRNKKKKKKKSKKQKYTKAEEEEARNAAIQMAEWAAEREASSKRTFEDATFNRIFLEDELKEAFQNTEMTTEDIDQLEVKLKAAKKKEKETEVAYKKAKKDAHLAEKMIDMKKSKRDKLLAKIEKEKMKERIEEGRRLQAAAEKEEETVEKREEKNQEVWANEANEKSLKRYSAKEDVMVNPPEVPCEYAYDDVDEFTGKRRRDLVKRLFFTHTSDRLKPYFRERDHINCEGFLSASSGGLKYLNLQITILSEQAQREFGVLEKGSILSLKLLNGNAVKLLNTKTSTGTVSKLNKTTTYRGQYLISPDQEKQIKKSEVDKVRIVWSTGYEDYEVYELDFFLDQFKCLDD